MIGVDKKSVYSIREVARLLRVSYGTIDKAAREKKISHYRLGGKRVCSGEDVQMFLDRSRVCSVNEENSVTA